jgi:hypothetical protein
LGGGIKDPWDDRVRNRVQPGGWTWVVAVAVGARHRGSTAGRLSTSLTSLPYPGRKELPLMLTTALEDDRRYWRVSCWQQYSAVSALLQIRHPLSQSHTRAPAIYPLQHSLVPLTTTMADTSDPACSCSVHLAPFGALHEPRRRHAPPAPMAACRLGLPPIIQAMGHKARNTHPDTNTPSPRS